MLSERRSGTQGPDTGQFLRGSHFSDRRATAPPQRPSRQQLTLHRNIAGRISCPGTAMPPVRNGELSLRPRMARSVTTPLSHGVH